MTGGLNHVGWLSAAHPPRRPGRWMRRVPALCLTQAPCRAPYPPYPFDPPKLSTVLREMHHLAAWCLPPTGNAVGGDRSAQRTLRAPVGSAVRTFPLVPAAVQASRTGSRGFTMKVAQRRCGSGFSRDETSRVVRASRVTASASLRLCVRPPKESHAEAPRRREEARQSGFRESRSHRGLSCFGGHGQPLMAVSPTSVAVMRLRPAKASTSGCLAAGTTIEAAVRTKILVGRATVTTMIEARMGKRGRP